MVTVARTVTPGRGTLMMTVFVGSGDVFTITVGTGTTFTDVLTTGVGTGCGTRCTRVPNQTVAAKARQRIITSIAFVRLT